MTGPGVKAPTDQMQHTAAGWQAMAGDLTPAQIDELLAALQGGQWPSQQGVAELVAALRNLQAARAQMAGANASTLASSAGALAGADKANAGKLGLGEAVKLGEIAGLIQAFTGPGAQLGGASTQAIAGIIGSGEQALVYPATGVLGGIIGPATSAGITTTGAHHDGPPAGAPFGPGSLSPTEFHPDTPAGSTQTPPVHVRAEMHQAH
jgi:hypothetical protein